MTWGTVEASPSVYLLCWKFKKAKNNREDVVIVWQRETHSLLKTSHRCTLNHPVQPGFLGRRPSRTLSWHQHGAEGRFAGLNEPLWMRFMWLLVCGFWFLLVGSSSSFWREVFCFWNLLKLSHSQFHPFFGTESVGFTATNGRRSWEGWPNPLSCSLLDPQFKRPAHSLKYSANLSSHDHLDSEHFCFLAVRLSKFVFFFVLGR